MASQNRSPHQDRGVDNALKQTLLHRLLSLSEQLSDLPVWAVIAALVFDALLAGVIWASASTLADGLAAGGMIAAAGAINAVTLVMLPRMGRSWGDPKPPLLALTAAQAVITAVLGTFSAPLWLAAGVTAAITGVAFYATWIEPFWLTITHERLNLSESEGHILRIAHVGDLHLERISPRERKVNQVLAKNPPDVLVFSGDYVNISYTYDGESERQIRQTLAEWRARCGVFVVPGTPQVEPLERVIAFTQGIDGLTLLLNQWQTITTDAGTVHLLGLVTTHDLTVDRAALRDAMTNAPSEPGLRVLLTHSPDIAPQAAEAGFHLYLCGHTHGGQIRLPLIGAVMTASQLGRTSIMGRRRVGNMTLYITRGLGMEGFGAPRARFLCPPEIIFWEIRL